MPILPIAIAVVVGALVLTALATRLPAVEDALFARALSAAVAGPKAELFDGDGLKVFFCGTGSPLPSAKRAQTCTAIIAGERYFLVDAGTGSWENVQAAGVPGARLAAVFVTHFHSDHVGDLSEANLGSWAAGRKAPLSVYGPTGVDSVIRGENDAFSLDSDYRTAHHGEEIAAPAGRGMRAFAFDGSTPTVILNEDGLRVTAFPVKHDPVVPAVGYRFDYKGRSVVISGDTAYSSDLVAAAKGADVLIHEAQANHMVAKMQAATAKAGAAATAKIFADIPSYHTSPEEAARAANEAGADWLVLTHLTPAPDNPVAKRIFLRGVSKVRAKNVRLAEDRNLILLPESGRVAFKKI
jgi:ribonuclease Z